VHQTNAAAHAAPHTATDAKADAKADTAADAAADATADAAADAAAHTAAHADVPLQRHDGHAAARHVPSGPTGHPDAGGVLRQLQVHRAAQLRPAQRHVSVRRDRQRLHRVRRVLQAVVGADVQHVRPGTLRVI
jgi:hypothetical protein